jgi:hypothetical protein
MGQAGPAGPPGSIVGTKVVQPAAVTSAPQPPVGTQLVAKAGCPGNDLVLGGGGRISVSAGTPDGRVVLQTSFPLNANHWEVVAVVAATLGPGVTASLKPYVTCGTP